jgi:DNA ligase D-like protein (predicted polymerase)
VKSETREGVELSSLDGPLFDGAVVGGPGVEERPGTKRDLVDYLDAVHHAILPAVQGRALSVMRVRPGQQPFMQKNLPKYAPDWIARTSVWAEASHREVTYPLCDDRRTLLWLANQRAVEYHPALIRAGERHTTHLVLDLDPPDGDDFAHVVRAAMLIRRVLDDLGLVGAVKTSGSKGVHIIVPITAVPLEESAAATRAIAARAEALDPEIATTAFIKADRGGKVFLDSTRAIGATVVAAYSPRIRPGLTVSFPVSWDDLPTVTPADFTIATAPALVGDGDPWAAALPDPQELPAELVEHGHTIPVARVAAMHEGKRRKRAREKHDDATEPS